MDADTARDDDACVESRVLLLDVSEGDTEGVYADADSEGEEDRDESSELFAGLLRFKPVPLKGVALASVAVVAGM